MERISDFWGDMGIRNGFFHWWRYVDSLQTMPPTITKTDHCTNKKVYLTIYIIISNMNWLIHKTKSTFSLSPHTLHKSQSTPQLLTYPTYPPPTLISHTADKLEQGLDDIIHELNLMNNTVQYNTNSFSTNFITEIANQNTNFLLLKQLHYFLWTLHFPTFPIV